MIYNKKYKYNKYYYLKNICIVTKKCYNKTTKDDTFQINKTNINNNLRFLSNKNSFFTYILFITNKI